MNEYSFWNATQNLMSKDLLKFDSSFLEHLASKENDLVDQLCKYKFAAKMAHKNANILEINCGHGFGSPIIAEMAKNYVGIDSNTDLIGLAKENFKGKKFTFSKDIDNKALFDVIINLNSFQALDSIVNFENNYIENHLTNNGIFILGISNNTDKNDLSHIQNLQNFIVKKMQKSFQFVLKFHSVNNFVYSGLTTKAEYLFLICFEKF
ncbi:MAG: hypothetical protein K940chlam1_00591 [Candidatus Anoxychlamydiales bacterium]|nr:hypothetical protein [Candidatus Anoxychlamydiales bacterium]NGX35516.1 hypothetical protein [Candidatus Anoxychlamydiales bacterium]